MQAAINQTRPTSTTAIVFNYTVSQKKWYPLRFCNNMRKLSAIKYNFTGT